MGTALGLTASVLAVIGSALSAAGATGPEAMAATIAPLVDGETIVVVRIDVAAIDMDAATRWAGESRRFGKDYIKHYATGYTNWQSKFLQAGGRELYLLFGVGRQRSAWAAVVPVVDGADGRELLAAVKTPVCYLRNEKPGPFGLDGACAIHGRFVIGATNAKALAYLRALKPVRRPELLAAFQAAGDPAFHTAGDVAVRAAFIPPAALRNLMRGPKRPWVPGSSAEDAAFLADGVKWVSVAISPPKDFSATVTIQTPNATAAARLRDIIGAGLQAAANLPTVRLAISQPGHVASMLLPNALGDQLIVNLPTPRATYLAGWIPRVLRARRTALQEVSRNRLHLILTGIQYYIHDHDGTPPPDLDALVKEGPIPREALISPISGVAGYVYIRPPAAKDITDPSSVVVLYEQPHTHEHWYTAVAFADGSVATLPVKEETYEKINAARAKSVEYYKDAAPVTASDAPPFEPGVGLGGATFGMSKDDAVSRLGPPDYRSAGGGNMLVYLTKGFAVQFVKGKLSHIYCFDVGQSSDNTMGRYKGKSPEGIGIGSTPDEVQAAYGRPTRQSPPAKDIVLLYQNLGTVFECTDGKVAKITLRSP